MTTHTRQKFIRDQNACQLARATVQGADFARPSTGCGGIGSEAKQAPTFNRFMNWGHRGASGHQPENTLLAFQTAIAMGANGIECDIRESRDGRLIIFHDETLTRIAGSPSPINQLTFSEIRKVNAGNQERIPELKELLKTTPPDFLLNLEIKEARPEKLLDQVYRHHVEHRVLLSSFDSETLLRIRSLDSTISLGYLVNRKEESAVFKKANKMKATALHLSSRLITKDKIARVHQEGFLVYAYTVDAPKQMSHFIKMGINGLFTNYPDRLSHLQIKEMRKNRC